MEKLTEIVEGFGPAAISRVPNGRELMNKINEIIDLLSTPVSEKDSITSVQEAAKQESSLT